MNVRIFCIGLAMSAVALQINTGLGGQEEKGAESVTLNAKEGSVVFPHGRHQKIFVDCQPCHGLFPKEPQVIGKMKVEGKLKGKEVMDMCKKCHEARHAKQEKAGPTECKECHVK